MTVAELRRVLAAFPQNARVVVVELNGLDGTPSTYEEIEGVGLLRVVPLRNVSDTYRAATSKDAGEVAVVLG